MSDPTIMDALQAIADLPTGKNEDEMNGQETAYRAVEALVDRRLDEIMSDDSPLTDGDRDQVDVLRLVLDAAELRLRLDAYQEALDKAEKIVVMSIQRMRAAHVSCMDLTNEAEQFLRECSAARAALEKGKQS